MAAEEKTLDQIQTQPQEQEVKIVKIIYYLHNDDFYSTHKKPLIIYANGRIYNGFVKERVHTRDMYYIYSSSQQGNIYVKLWKDTRNNILVYISSVKILDEFFTNYADTILIDNLHYDDEAKVLYCGKKLLKFEGFDIINILEKLEPELIPPVLAVICAKLT